MFINRSGQFGRGLRGWFQRELVCPSYSSRDLHRDEKRGNGTNGDSKSSKAPEEERVGEHHQVDKLRQRRLATCEVESYDESQITYDEKDRHSCRDSKR